MAYARIARVCDVAIKVCGAACAAVYRAYAIRPYKRRKTKVAKTTSNVEKTISYVEKIISDIIHTISDMVFPMSDAVFGRRECGVSEQVLRKL